MHIASWAIFVVMVMTCVQLMIWGVRLKSSDRQLSREHEELKELIIKDHDEIKGGLALTYKQGLENGKKLDMILNIATNNIVDGVRK